ncbi:hypothetical protein UFOVP380_53 [uncultured Caudovirales phage]|uniref:Uncharacterized protein n=1 Tax=uncultured Caudovirales phage TaxID=2100421 RepID=A0A6J7X025_9CAUD|nr:hypothetical protein UFOVP380_53 [uncultured Caudovirales phage]
MLTFAIVVFVLLLLLAGIMAWLAYVDKDDVEEPNYGPAEAWAFVKETKQ